MKIKRWPAAAASGWAAPPARRQSVVDDAFRLHDLPKLFHERPEDVADERCGHVVRVHEAFACRLRLRTLRFRRGAGLGLSAGKVFTQLVAKIAHRETLMHFVGRPQATESARYPYPSAGPRRGALRKEEENGKKEDGRRMTENCGTRYYAGYPVLLVARKMGKRPIGGRKTGRRPAKMRAGRGDFKLKIS
jgi:hypothetical protein